MQDMLSGLVSSVNGQDPCGTSCQKDWMAVIMGGEFVKVGGPKETFYKYRLMTDCVKGLLCFSMLRSK